MNVVVGPPDATGSAWGRRIARTLFQGEEYSSVDVDSVPALLVALGIYATRSEARRAGRDGAIPLGYSELRASKKVPRLCIWRYFKPERTLEELAEFRVSLRLERDRQKGGAR